jgi:hypothetical protein
MPDQIDRLIAANDARAYLSIGSTKFYDEVAAGRLAIVKNGRRSFVRASELARYIDALSAGNGNKSP